MVVINGKTLQYMAILGMLIFCLNQPARHSEVQNWARVNPRYWEPWRSAPQDLSKDILLEARSSCTKPCWNGKRSNKPPQCLTKNEAVLTIINWVLPHNFCIAGWMLACVTSARVKFRALFDGGGTWWVECLSREYGVFSAAENHHHYYHYHHHHNWL